MSCNKCQSSPCCCGAPYQLPGPMGPQGVPGIQGNPGAQGPAGSVAPFSTEIISLPPPDGSHLAASVIGGVGVLTYLWTIKSKVSDIPGVLDTSIIAGQGTPTITLLVDGTERRGLIELKVTDANLNVTKAYWWSDIIQGV